MISFNKCETMYDKIFVWKQLKDLSSIGNDFQRVTPSYMKLFFMLLVRCWGKQSELETPLSSIYIIRTLPRLFQYMIRCRIFLFNFIVYGLFSAQAAKLLCEEQQGVSANTVKYVGYCSYHWNKKVKIRNGSDVQIYQYVMFWFAKYKIVLNDL